jgi:hypothetical protein
MKNALLVLIIVISHVVFSQKNSGFYGHKLFIQSEFLGNYPFFSNLGQSNGNTNYVCVSNTLVAQKDRFNFGFRINAGYAFKRNMSLLLELGQDYSNATPNNQIYFNDFFGNLNIQHEMVDLVTNIIIPKIEFGTSNSLFPMGLSHQFGLGVAKTNLKEKDYLWRYNDYQFVTPYTHYSENQSNPIDFNQASKIKKIVLLYALNIRTPVSEHLMINYGIKYTLNFGSKNTFDESTYTGLLMKNIATHRSRSFINASIGLTYVF